MTLEYLSREVLKNDRGSQLKGALGQVWDNMRVKVIESSSELQTTGR